jgi:gluconolactonase
MNCSLRLSGWTGICALVGLLAIASTACQLARHRRGVIAPTATIQRLATGFAFTEGPVAHADGNVYFSDIPNQRINKWTGGGNVTVYRENSGGANGLFFDARGHLIACEGRARRVTDDDMKGRIAVLADSYDGKKLNSPNDLWIDPKNGIYFTDPRYGSMEGLEQDGMHVYYILPDRSKLIRVCNDLKRPNGLIGTPDGKTLYIADPGDSKTWRYRIQPDGRLADKTLFCERGSDGMTMDERGNVYLTDGSVWVYSPGGEVLAEIKTPEAPANVTFAGEDGRTLFVTARKSIYAVDMSVAGTPRKR